jgi:hypothetical protein
MSRMFSAKLMNIRQKKGRNKHTRLDVAVEDAVTVHVVERFQ